PVRLSLRLWDTRRQRTDRRVHRLAGRLPYSEVTSHCIVLTGNLPSPRLFYAKTPLPTGRLGAMPNVCLPDELALPSCGYYNPRYRCTHSAPTGGRAHETILAGVHQLRARPLSGQGLHRHRRKGCPISPAAQRVPDADQEPALLPVPRQGDRVARSPARVPGEQ